MINEPHNGDVLVELATLALSSGLVVAAATMPTSVHEYLDTVCAAVMSQQKRYWGCLGTMGMVAHGGGCVAVHQERDWNVVSNEKLADGPSIYAIEESSVAMDRPSSVGAGMGCGDEWSWMLLEEIVVLND